jgi:uncharacterized protein (DUF4415 family)
MKKSSTSKKSGTDFKRLAAMKDEDIDFSDLPEATPEMLASAVVRPGREVTEPQEELTVVLDRDLAKWYRDIGPEYNGIINYLLRRHMQERLRKLAEPKARRA